MSGLLFVLRCIIVGPFIKLLGFTCQWYAVLKWYDLLMDYKVVSLTVMTSPFLLILILFQFILWYILRKLRTQIYNLSLQCDIFWRNWKRICGFWIWEKKRFWGQRKYRFKESSYIHHITFPLHKKFFHKRTYISTLVFEERTQTLQHSNPQLVVTISLLAPELSA